MERDDQGLLIINANTVLYLNETATAHAYYFMQGMTTDEAVAKIRRMYRVDEKTARADYEKLVYTVSSLAQTEEICPVSFLDVEKVEPFTHELSAPLRVDLALTFRCQNNCSHCYAGGPHETPELSTEHWKQIIDRLHQIGVFILTFTGGEPTLRNDLPEPVSYTHLRAHET